MQIVMMRGDTCSFNLTFNIAWSTQFFFGLSYSVYMLCDLAFSSFTLYAFTAGFCISFCYQNERPMEHQALHELILIAGMNN